jgi:hypothetical protein
MTLIRKLAITYAASIFLAAVLAWSMDVGLMHSTREHLLPDIVLSVLSAPASLSMGFMYESWPAAFSGPFVQLAWLTLCGMVQATVVYLVAGLAPAKHGEA